MKNLFLKILFLMILIMFYSCIASNVDNKSPKLINNELKEKLESRKYLIPGSSLLPEQNIIDNENKNKKLLFPEASATSWVISEIEKNLKFIGMENWALEELSGLVINTVKVDIFLKIGVNSLKYEKPSFQNCNFNYQDLKKGDIILTKTYNPFSSVIEGRESFHHAYLCIKDPTSDEDLSIITTMGAEDPYVNLYPVNWIANNDSEAVILRLYNKELIDMDKVINFALAKIGCPYNVEFIDKTLTDRFYCSQLVWRSYLEAGVNLDYNDFDYNDYGIVLVNDLYKSPYLYVVKHIQ